MKRERERRERGVRKRDIYRLYTYIRAYIMLCTMQVTRANVKREKKSGWKTEKKEGRESKRQKGRKRQQEIERRGEREREREIERKERERGNYIFDEI